MRPLPWIGAGFDTRVALPWPLRTGALLRTLLAGVLAWWLLLGHGSARAHEISMAEMVVWQNSPTEFSWQWTAAPRTGGASVRLRWPDGCDSPEPQRLRCGAQGLSGRVAVEGLGEGTSALLLKMHWLDGGLRVYTFSQGQREIMLHGSAEDRRDLAEIARAYTALGIEHILAGIDHLLFVVGLLFLVGFRRQLVWTISAFTVAHSLTLGLSALGWLSLRTPPVEATIALSIMLVAGEALHRRPTVSRRWPALVALLFGLVHGLGFAGALQAIGLPQQHLLAALLTFNLGVELGQLAVVGSLWVAWRLLSTRPWLARARTPVLYAIGSLAAWWTLARVATLAGPA